MKLGNVANILMGQSPKGDSYNNTGEGIPLLNGPTEFGPSHPVPALWTTQPTKLCKSGDLLFCVRGSTGRMNWADQTYCLGRGVAGIHAKSESSIDTKFIYYQVVNQLPALLAISTGSVFTNLSSKEFARFEIDWPDPKQREDIASILGILDDKIELNRKTNETLETIAQALFKDWCVDFGPTRAKAEGQAPYLAPEIWELFPDALDDDDKPIAWHKQQLGELLSLTKGRSYKSAELQESNTALVTLKSFRRGGGYHADGLKPYTGSFKQEQVVSYGELVVALTDITQAAEVIGKPAIVPKYTNYKTLVASLDVGILRPNPGALGTPYLYCLLRTDEFQNHIYGHCTGTTVLHLRKQGISSFELRLPPDDLLIHFQCISEPIFSKIGANNEESRTLRNIRDFLLPKLMSGEIRLRDAEKTVEVVL